MIIISLVAIFVPEFGLIGSFVGSVGMWGREGGKEGVFLCLFYLFIYLFLSFLFFLFSFFFLGGSSLAYIIPSILTMKLYEMEKWMWVIQVHKKEEKQEEKNQKQSKSKSKSKSNREHKHTDLNSFIFLFPDFYLSLWPFCTSYGHFLLNNRNYSFLLRLPF